MKSILPLRGPGALEGILMAREPHSFSLYRSLPLLANRLSLSGRVSIYLLQCKGAGGSNLRFLNKSTVIANLAMKC